VSKVTTASRFEQVKLPNSSSISYKKWNFNDIQAKDLQNTVTSLGYLILTVAVLFSLKPILAVTNEFVVFGVLLIVPSAAIYFLPKLGKRLSLVREKKRDEYRRENASTIINLLNEQGWTLWNKDSVETLVSDNNPYLVNPEGVRYYAKYFDIRDASIIFHLTLSDNEVEDNLRKVEKQKQIEYQMRLYEISNGVMSPEKREGFVAALELSL
jgi:hypothetical protein